ncbi:MAG: type II toxin-antitoxin system RelE/ParE family toxin [Woeseiaceae bacterium]
MAPRRRQVVWAERARRALDDALAYIAQHSTENARRLAERVLERADSLDIFSERGRMVREVGDPNLRELLVDPYRLMYEVHEHEVQIVGFVHQRRRFVPGQ